MTQSPPSPMAEPQTWGDIATTYAEDVAPVFEPYALEALQHAGLQTGMAALDVACGPGTLSLLAARAGASVTAVDFAAPMVEVLKQRASKDGLTVDARVADGMALPMDDHSFDVAFSMFGLMFFPDRARGFAELYRVLRPGGCAVVASWQALDNVPQLAACLEIMGDILQWPKRQGGFALTDSASCTEEMTAGGFSNVAVHTVTGDAQYPSTTAMLATWVRSSAPIALTARTLGPARWAPVSQQLLQRLSDRFGNGPQATAMTANLSVGRRAA